MKTRAEKEEAENLTGLDGITHGFYTSCGGVSQGIYASLNCGPGSRDEPEHVALNRQRVAADLGTSSERLASVHQVHSARAVIADAPFDPADRPKADAIVTNRPGLAVGVLTADCAPVLFGDPKARVVGAAHAGWRGAFGGVLDDTIEKMVTLGAARAHIRACVGPAISREVYEVGDEFRDNLLRGQPDNERFFALPSGAQKVHFDLPAFCAHRLQEAGLQHVEVIPHCTFTMADRYFSFRRSQRDGHEDYGRQISAIVIR